jgi:hypothetical protein
VEEIVIVSGNLSRRFAKCHGSQTGDGQRAGRQQLLLDFPRRQHLLLHPYLLGVLLEELPHLAGHDVEGIGQLAELILRADRDLMVEVAVSQMFRSRKQIVNGAGDLPCEHEADRERDELNH